MSADGTGPGRVLVLLDGSQRSLEVLEAAAEMAQLRGSDVLGLFVEEINLLRSAGYGWSREIGGSSGQARPLTQAQLESRMLALAEQARQALEKAMAARGVTQRFLSYRGHVPREVRNIAGPQDLLILGRSGWNRALGLRLGSTALAMLEDAPGDVMIWTCPRPERAGTIAVLASANGDADRRAIDIAATIARQKQYSLLVLIPTEAEEPAPEDLHGLQPEGVATRTRAVFPLSTHRVSQLLKEERVSQLVISRTSPLFRNTAVESLLASLELPLTITA